MNWGALVEQAFAIGLTQLAAVVFVQGFLVEGLRFLGDWRNLLFGGLIVLAMNLRPRGLLDVVALRQFKLFRGKDHARA